MKTSATKPRRQSITNLIFLDDVTAAIEHVRERCLREQDQALLNRNLEDARWSLAQRDACNRVEREILWLVERAAGHIPSAQPEGDG